MIESPAPFFRVPSRGENLSSLSLPNRRTKSRRTSTIDLQSSTENTFPGILASLTRISSLIDLRIPSEWSPATSRQRRAGEPASRSDAPGGGMSRVRHRGAAPTASYRRIRRGAPAAGTCCYDRCNGEEKHQCTSELDLLRRHAGDPVLLWQRANKIGRWMQRRGGETTVRG